MSQAAIAAFGALAVVPITAEAQVADVARLGDRILDPSARGQVTFENTANVASYQQDGILTYRGYQYTGWYRGDRRAVIARRAFPNGAWESTELDYDLFRDDSHNTISMAVTPTDGRLHIAFPTHANAIRYARSIPGVADRPAAVEWSSTLFERTRNHLPGAPAAPVNFTYPQFEIAHGRMLLTYREATASSNGRQVLLRYDDNQAGTWTYLGLFTDSVGTYASPYGTSNSRYAYLHGFAANPVDGNLELAFTWREQASAGCPHPGILATNHDTGYAYSPDGGTTWKNNDGQTIGVLDSDDLISIDDPHVVEEIPVGRGLMNSEAQAFDSQGRLHVMTSRVPERDLDEVGGCVTDFYRDRARLARPYHSFRDHDGTWQTIELPTRQGSSGRTKITFDSHDTAYVILPDARIIAATAISEWTDWRIVFDAGDVENVSELIIDRTRVRHDGVLTVAYQEPSEGGAPSAYRLADFQLGTHEPDRPKETDPETAPRRFEGTAEAATDPSEPTASTRLPYTWPPQPATSDATPAGNEAPAPLHSNGLHLVRVEHLPSKGRARLVTRVSAAGTLRLLGNRRVGRAGPRTVGGPGRVRLLVRPRGRARTKLNRLSRSTGEARVRVRAGIRFMPAAGEPRVKSRRLALIKRR